MRHVTLLPEPDSPTIPSVSPGSIANETPSTAWTKPSSVRKRVRRFSTSSRAVSEPDPRIEDRVETVDDQVEQDDHDGREHDDADDHREIRLLVRDDHLAAETRQVEDRLREDGAAECQGDVEPEDGDDREHAVPEDVRAEHRVLGDALGPCGAHVVLAHRLHHVRSDEPDVERREEQRERAPGQDHVVRPLHRTAALRADRRVDEVAVTGDRRDAEVRPEDERQDETDPDRVRRDPDEHEDHRAPVDQRPRAQRRVDADRDRTRSQRMAPPKTSDAVTGAALMMMSFTSSRLTNDRPRDCSKTSCFIQSPYCFQTGSSRFRYCGDLLDLLGGRGLAGGELCRVVRGHEEDDVRDEGHGHEQEHGPHQASGDESPHRRSSVSHIGRDSNMSPTTGARAPKRPRTG